jgi:hypothetical protein
VVCKLEGSGSGLSRYLEVGGSGLPPATERRAKRLAGTKLRFRPSGEPCLHRPTPGPHCRTHDDRRCPGEPANDGGHNHGEGRPQFGEPRHRLTLAPVRVPTAQYLSSSMRDYAGAWEAVRERCHRYVYTSDEDGRPMPCPQPVVSSGWVLAEHTGKWHFVDACELHSSGLLDRPGPRGRRLGR